MKRVAALSASLVLTLLLFAPTAARPSHAGTSTAPVTTSLSHGWGSVPMGRPRDGDQAAPRRIIRTSSGVLAYGTVSFADGITEQTVWNSRDGVIWQQHTLNQPAFAHTLVLSDIVRFRDGFVGVGGTLPVQDGHRLQGAAWTSKDGLVWRKVPNVKPFAGAVAVRVTEGGPGLVAVGSGLAGKIGTTPTTKLFAVVWTSRDGVTWRRTPYSQTTFGGAEMFDVSAGGPGLVAVGHNTRGGEHSVVWTSRDGVHWRRLPNAFTNFGPLVVTVRVVSGPYGRLLAVGVDQNTINESRAWTSTDGMHWQPAPAGAFQQGTVTNVAAAGPGFLAVGTQESDPVLWSSPDGLQWRHEAGPEVFTGSQTRVYDVAPFGDRLVVAGIRYARDARSSSTGRATAWLWSPGQTQGTPQPTPRPALSDPKTFRLRLADIPSDYHIRMLDYEPVCRADDSDPGRPCAHLKQAIGRYRAFVTVFAVNTPKVRSLRLIRGITIVTSSTASAQRALQYGGVVVSPYPGLARTARLPLHARIAEESRLYNPTEIMRNARFIRGYVVIWRDGRFMGSVTVAGEPRAQAIVDAIRYTQRLHAHLAAAR